MTPRHKKRGRIAAAFGAALLGFGCQFQPPIVKAGGTSTLDPTNGRYPPGTEVVEVTVENG